MDAETKHESLLVREARANQKDEVIVVHGDQWLVRGTERVAVVIGPDGHENERLAAQFAAAPDLLKSADSATYALKHVLDAVEEHEDILVDTLKSALDGLRAAIAKAAVTP